MPIQHITELFCLLGRDFVTEAYRNLLKREPDEHGMAYYLGRLAQGYGKTAVIEQLAQSTECRPLDEIKGLKKLVADERRAQHWFFGIFFRHGRIKNLLISNSDFFERFGCCMDCSRASEKGQVRAHLDNLPKDETNPAFINNSVITELYVGLLGREPESSGTIEFYENIGSLTEAVKMIISSEEFHLFFLKNYIINSLNISSARTNNSNAGENFANANLYITGINSSQRTPLETHFKTYEGHK